MIQEFSETELKKLRDGLRVLTDKDYPLHHLLREQLTLISRSLSALDGHIANHPFVDEDAEIDYYKYILPRFKSLQVYYTERYALLSGTPKTTEKFLKKYYLDELQYIDRFFGRHHFQREYFSLELDNMDNLWFKREQNADFGLPPVMEGYEAVDSPQMSYLFAKFMAFNRLREDIMEMLGKLERPKLVPEALVPTTDKPKKSFRWTGEKIHLIELVHGLYVRKQVNGGKIGIGEFFEAVGGFFGIDLGIPKRGFDDLKLRKRLSKTHFIDSMKEELLRKMEEEDAYDPEKLGGKRFGFS